MFLFRFAEKGTLIYHSRTHSEIKPNSTKKLFASSPELKLHEKIAKKNVCDVCGKDFTSPSSLAAHIRIHSGEKPFSCMVCSKTFANKSSLRKHSAVHANKV